MSGHKIASVTISQDEYRRLYQLEKNIQYQAAPIVQPQSTLELEDLRRNISLDLGNRHDSYIAMVSSIREDVAEVEYHTSQRLFAQQQEVLELIRDQNREIISNKNNENELRKLLSTISTAIEKIDFNQMNYAQEFDRLIIEKMGKDANLEDNIASTLGMAGEIIALIERDYPGHLIDFSEIEQIRDTLNVSNDNLRTGFLESALSTSQTALISARKIYNKVQLEFFRYITLYGEMIVQFNNLSLFFDQNQSFDPIDTNGSLIEPKMGMNPWSKGAFAFLVEDMNQLGETIQESHFKLTIEEVEKILGNLLPEFQRKYSDCLTDARLEVISSQRRFEIANKIILGLIEQGYQPVYGDYAEHSFFNGYVAAVENGYSKINIFIDPVEDNPIENEVHIVSLDFNQISKHELELRAAAVKNSINGPILVTSAFVEVKNVPSAPKPQKKPNTISVQKHKK